MHITLATTGDTVEMGRLVQAVAGPYAGSWWRLDDVRKDNGTHIAHVSRRHRVGRHVMHCPAEIFGLIVQEAVAFVQHAWNMACAARRKVDDGIVLGFLALIPLALFEAFHGGEATRQLLESLFGASGAEGGH